MGLLRGKAPHQEHDTDPEVAYAHEQIAELTTASYDGVARECDMVMKGGITSGVVYPLTICRLATQYRLRSIGGTSAGAIAAGIAAGAEHRRQTATGSDAGAGYQVLATLPNEIGGILEDLFQPRPDTKRLFGVLNSTIDPNKRGLGKTVAVLKAIIAGKLTWFVGGLALILGIVLPGLIVTTGFPIEGSGVWRVLIGLALPAVLAIAVGTFAAVVGLALEANRVLPAAGFALTDGATHHPTNKGLTEWLADKIDEVAGLDPKARCLTVGDLWGKTAVVEWKRWHDADGVNIGPGWRSRRARRVELEVMTTDLTLRRPFRMPFTTQAFMFSKDEMSALFPPRVVATMAQPAFLTDHRHPDTGELLYAFPGQGSAKDETHPGPEHLPVIVIVRMSLSFPGLISAVPLYAVDFNGDQSVVRHWFSDGGVSSNFPMHFFDSLLPTRPTFGVNLTAPHPLHPDSTVWRPAPTGGGMIPRVKPFAGLGGFVGALRDTMQNWADNKQVTQRGYADRVVEIRLCAEEGGMNLRMPEDRILRLVARGGLAGASLLEFDWDAHRVIRYRSAMARLADSLDRMRSAWEADGGSEYPGHLGTYPDAAEPASSYIGGSTWRTADLKATQDLIDVIVSWEQEGWPALDVSWPQPAPHIRLAPE